MEILIPVEDSSTEDGYTEQEVVEFDYEDGETRILHERVLAGFSPPIYIPPVIIEVNGVDVVISGPGYVPGDPIYVDLDIPVVDHVLWAKRTRYRYYPNGSRVKISQTPGLNGEITRKLKSKYVSNDYISRDAYEAMLDAVENAQTYAEALAAAQAAASNDIAVWWANWSSSYYFPTELSNYLGGLANKEALKVSNLSRSKFDAGIAATQRSVEAAKAMLEREIKANDMQRRVDAIGVLPQTIESVERLGPDGPRFLADVLQDVDSQSIDIRPRGTSSRNPTVDDARVGTVLTLDDLRKLGVLGQLNRPSSRANVFVVTGWQIDKSRPRPKIGDYTPYLAGVTGYWGHRDSVKRQETSNR